MKNLRVLLPGIFLLATQVMAVEPLALTCVPTTNPVHAGETVNFIGNALNLNPDDQTDSGMWLFDAGPATSLGRQGTIIKGSVDTTGQKAGDYAVRGHITQTNDKLKNAFNTTGLDQEAWCEVKFQIIDPWAAPRDK